MGGIERSVVKRLLSPRDLATAIGMSESSLKRWADAGRLEVSRTSGGHRRITIAEAVRFIRATGHAVVRPDLLGLGDIQQDLSTSDDTLYQLLLEGRGRDVRGLLMARYLAGESIAALADHAIRGAMARIGTMWRHDQRGVFLEHRATDCCVHAVAALRGLLEPNEHAPPALGGAPGGDPYVLPSLLVATLLEAEGMAVDNLGPGTPVPYLRVAIEQRAPRLVWLSCSTPVPPEVAREVAALAELLRERGALLVLGGRHVEDLAMVRQAHVAATMTELAALARGLVLTAGRSQTN